MKSYQNLDLMKTNSKDSSINGLFFSTSDNFLLLLDSI